MSRNEKTWLIASIVILGFWAAIAYHYFLGYYLGNPYPKNTFLAMPSDVGNDFFHIVEAVRTGSPYSYKWSVYFPFTYVPIVPFAFFSRYPGYVLFIAVFVGTVLHLFYNSLGFLNRFERCAATIALSFLTYPVIFALERGNVEFLVFIFLYLFLISYQREQLKRSVFFLACAGAMKLYPLVFVVLFVQRRQYKHLLCTILTACLLTLASAASYPTGIKGSFGTLATILTEYRAIYVIGDEGLPYGSSYFAMLKIIVGKLYPLTTTDAVTHILPYYTMAALCFFAVVALYLASRERTLWKTVAILTSMMILLPHVSCDYKLIHLLLAVTLFIAAKTKKRTDAVYALLFGLLLIPNAFFWIRHTANLQLVPGSVMVNPLLMTALIVLIVVEGLFSPKPNLDESPGVI